MSYSLIKKSVLCTLLIGLTMSIQQTSAMDSHKPQASSGSSLVSVVSGVALSAVAALGLYSWHKHIQDTNNKEKQERHKKLTILEKHDRLLKAIKNNDEKRINYWLGMGADINWVSPIVQIGKADCPNYEGNTTALSYAIEYADLNTLRMLFKNGAQVNMVVNPQGFSHLGLAAYVWPCLEKVQLLLSYGARLGNYDVTCRAQVSNFKRGLIPYRFSPLASAAKPSNHLSTQAKAIHDSIYGPGFSEITSRNDRMGSINQVVLQLIGCDASFIVNQFLCNEDPSVDAG